MLFSSELQTSIYNALITDPEVNQISGGHIYDEIPDTDLANNIIVIGEEYVRDKSSSTIAATVHDVQIKVLSQQFGFSEVKELSAAVRTVFENVELTIPEGKIATRHFIGASARRAAPPMKRQIIMTFRLLVESELN